MAEGILLGGYFLKKDEFIEICKEWLVSQYYKDLQQEIKNELVNIKGEGISFKSELTKEQLFKKWEEIEEKYFKNPQVTLIAAVKLNGENGEYTWTRNIPETKALKESSLSLATENVKKALLNAEKEKEKQKGIEINKIMSEHYINLQKSLDANNNLSQTDISILLNYYKNKNIKTIKALNNRLEINQPYGFLKKILNEKEKYDNYPVFQDKTLRTILYGNMVGGEGKILDAYMNHIGAKHRNILKWLTNVSRVKLNDIKKFMYRHQNIKVKDEEGNNFIPLLIGSLNNISWLAGGDIVVYNEKRQVVYNIQLKSTIYDSQSYHIATNKLLSVLKILLKKISKEDEAAIKKIAEELFKALKNDAANYENDFKEKISDQVINDIKKALLT